MSSKYTNDISDILKKIKIDIPLLNKKLYIFYFDLVKKSYLNNNLKIVKKDSKNIEVNNKKSFPLLNRIIIKLNERYPDIIDKLLSNLNLDSKKKDEYDFFLKNINSVEIENCIYWFNINGKKILQYISIMLENNKLPDDIMQEFKTENFTVINNFISLDIQDYCEKCLDKTIQFEVSLNNTISKIVMNYNHSYNIDSHINNIINRCMILSDIHNIKKEMNINLWFTPFLKKIPDTYLLLGPKEINSGSSGGYLDKVEIWRTEEMPKLVLHEVFHNLDLDSKHHNYDKVVKNIKKRSDISSNTSLLINESLTEIAAVLINCILCSLETNKGFNTFLKYLELERKYTIFQISKILIHFGYNNAFDFFKPKNKKHKFKQNTSVFSYFIVKGSILYNLDKYMEFSKKYFNKFQINLKYKDKLESLLISFIYNIDFINIINDTMKIYSNLKLNSNIKKSLRMTCVSNK